MRTRTSITTVVSEPSCLSNVIAAIVLILLFCLFIPAASAQSTEAPPATVFVQTALGGFILGYDIDQNGNEGLLSEALGSLEGESNWLSASERAGRLGTAAGWWIGIAVAVIAVLVWRKRRRAA